MTLPLLCALVYLLLSARVIADVRLTVNQEHKGASITLGMLGVRLCLDVPVAFQFDRNVADAQVKSARQAWPFIKAVLRAIRWGQTDVRMRIGTKDAALTALLCGAAGVMGAALQAAAGQAFPCEIRARPDFRAPAFALLGRCIFSFAPGDIMFAVVKEAVKKTKREGLSWLSIPLKA